MTPEINYKSIHEWSQDITDHLETELKKIDAGLVEVLEILEKSLPKHLQKEIHEGEPSSIKHSLLRATHRIVSILRRLSPVGKAIVKENDKLRQKIKYQQELLEELEIERDVLLQQIHAHLKANSSLRVRLEEQRCQTGAGQRQDLESQIKSLEKDKERLSVLNAEKDKQICKITAMLEQTAESFKSRETEVLNWKNKKNNLVSSLKADLKEVLGEKAKIELKYVSLRERLEHCFFNSVEGFVHKMKNPPLKRSLSMGDFGCINLHNLEKNIMLEQPQDICFNDISSQQFYKNTSKHKFHQTEDFFPNPWSSHETRSWNKVSVKVKDRLKSPPVHAQLTALQCDLLNVAKKLEALKFQLVSSGVIPEDPKPPESRNLKRKANPIEVEEEDDARGGASAEEPKLGFKNLKNILQDAKNLNEKLQNLREEKQKMIVLNNKKEMEMENDEKKNEEFSQTAHEDGPHSCKTR